MPDAPVADLIGISQGVSGHFAANACMVDPCGGCSQAGLDVAQTLAKGQLGKGHAQKLILAGETFDFERNLGAPNISSFICAGYYGRKPIKMKESFRAAVALGI